MFLMSQMQSSSCSHGLLTRRALLHASALATLAFASLVVSTEPVLAATLKKPELDALAASVQAQVPTSFDGFLAEAEKLFPSLHPSVAAYRNHDALTDDDLGNIGRLLGLYNRLHSEAAVVETLGEMVAYPTFRNDTVAPDKSPAVIAFGQLTEAFAQRFGLNYRNFGNHVFEVTLPGTGTEEFGILTHCDVVPVVADEWVLDDGRRLDPFQMTRVGDYLYGRGTIDDKGSIAAALYAMKAVKESGVRLARTIRLMIETTEETTGEGLAHYRRETTLPAYNIVLDSRYPAVVAEKGAGNLHVLFPVRSVPASVTSVTAITGAASANTIPQTATATLQNGDLDSVAGRLEAARASFVSNYEGQGGKFSIEVNQAADAVQVKVIGISAHGSRPEEGVNPLPRLTLFLRESGLALGDNHVLAAIDYVNDLYGLDYLGGRLGVGYRDDFMGPLTMSPTFAREKDGLLDVTVNVRMPRGNSPDALRTAMIDKINAWAGRRRESIQIDYKQDNWMARDPKGAWLTTLLNIFGDTTGLDAQPVSTAGSTTAKLMPNAINFGPAMPGKKYTAHNAKEYKEAVDLGADLQMLTEMLVRIGNLGSME
jgi:predicted dipeptidase